VSDQNQNQPVTIDSVANNAHELIGSLQSVITTFRSELIKANQIIEHLKAENEKLKVVKPSTGEEVEE